MVPIEIDFGALTYFIIGMFALVGFSRGWFREALTTILLMFMVFMLAQPELAASLIEILGVLVTAILKPFADMAGDTSRLKDLLDAIKGLFNVDNPYSFMLLITGFLILFSYAVGRTALIEGKVAPLSRLLGGTLGALNGFIVMSLAQQYLLTRLGIDVPRAPALPGEVAAAVPQQVPMSVKNIYALSSLSGITLALLFALGFIVLVFFLREMRLRQPKKKGG